jgi:hypothetical protein
VSSALRVRRSLQWRPRSDSPSWSPAGPSDALPPKQRLAMWATRATTIAPPTGGEASSMVRQFWASFRPMGIGDHSVLGSPDLPHLVLSVPRQYPEPGYVHAESQGAPASSMA